MRQKGFNLIELMIAVAVVAILASVAYPAYTGYVSNTRRADAKASLVTLANAMERAYSDTNTYTGLAEGGADLGFPATRIFVPLPAVTPFYEVKITAATMTSYTLAAIPKGPQVSDACGTFSITDTGKTEPATSGCW